MDVLDLASLYEYLIESRERFFAKFRELGWDEVTRNGRPPGARCTGSSSICSRWRTPGSTTTSGGRRGRTGIVPPLYLVRRCRAALADVTGRTRTFLNGLTEDRLVEDVVFDWSPGKARSSVQEVLVQAFIDEIAHLGELIWLMWQMDVTPPHVNWIAGHIGPAG